MLTSCVWRDVQASGVTVPVCRSDNSWKSVLQYRFMELQGDGTQVLRPVQRRTIGKVYQEDIFKNIFKYIVIEIEIHCPSSSLQPLPAMIPQKPVMFPTHFQVDSLTTCIIVTCIYMYAYEFTDTYEHNLLSPFLWFVCLWFQG